MACLIQEETFVDLPPAFVQLIHHKENILTIDKGLNSMKIVKLGTHQDKVKYYVCPIENLDDLINCLKVKRIVTDDVKINIMGYRVQELANKMKNVTLLSKTDSLVRGFTRLLTNSKWEELVHRPPDDVISRANRRLAFSKKAWASMVTSSSKLILHQEILNTLDRPYSKILERGSEKITDNEDIFPCLLVYLSSRIIIYKVNKDGCFQELDKFGLNGQCLEGLGTILSGAKNSSDCFQSFIKGKGMNVNSRIMDEINRDTDDVYSNWVSTDEQSERLAFCFGRGADPKKTFEKDDLANAWLQALCLGWQQQIHFHALCHKIKTVFVCGRLTNLQTIQDILTEEFIIKSQFYSATAGKDVSTEIYFIKNSQFIAALGGAIE